MANGDSHSDAYAYAHAIANAGANGDSHSDAHAYAHANPHYGAHAHGDSRALEFRSLRRLRGVRNRASRAN